MPTKSYFLTKENHEHLETRAAKTGQSMSSYLNTLLDNDRGGDFQTIPPIKETVKPVMTKKVYSDKEKRDRLNPLLCNACNHIKCAGKCINKECARFGK